jgi:hypothetical protein
MGFKKCTSLILVLVLLVSNLGLAINVHYCGQNIEALSLGFSNDEPCVKDEPKTDEKDCCGSKDAKDHEKCCSDDTLKSGVENVIIKQINLDNACSVFYIPEFQTPNWLTPISSIQKQEFQYCCDANAPPLFKLYSQFIFYA